MLIADKAFDADVRVLDACLIRSQPRARPRSYRREPTGPRHATTTGSFMPHAI